MTEKEYKALEKRTTSVSANADKEDSGDEEGLGHHNPGLQPHNTRNYSGKERDVKDRVRFKRKKAKVLFHSHLLTYINLITFMRCMSLT